MNELERSSDTLMVAQSAVEAPIIVQPAYYREQPSLCNGHCISRTAKSLQRTLHFIAMK